jgi:hypothetical protein
MPYLDPAAGAAREGLNASGYDSTEIGYLNGATAGAVVASKALVTDANNKLTGLRRSVVAKTADYTITAADSGKIFTNRGAAGAVNFTLPTVAAGFDGVEVTIMAVVAAQTVTVTAQTTGQLIMYNDAAGNSVAFSTTNEIIGGSLRAVCDGTSWLIMPSLWEAQTPVLTT